MANQNQLQKPTNLNQYLEMPKVVGRLSEKLGFEEAKKFKTALSSAVSTNPILLTECDPNTVVNAALIGHSLNLPPSPQLGYYYLVPYNNKKKGCKEAQFQIGYRGYIQLAMRSGYYRKLNVAVIKEGELKSWNPLTEEIEVKLVTDPTEREKLKTIGYCSFFEYVNGFSKTMYWTLEEMQLHADKYSKAYSLENDKLLKAGKVAKKDLWRFSSFWYHDFDGMAKKTMLRQMLSKWGSMNVDMQRAYEEDVKTEYGSYNEAAQNAQTNIDSDMGSEAIDTEFEQPEEENSGDDIPFGEDFDNDKKPGFMQGDE